MYSSHETNAYGGCSSMRLSILPDELLGAFEQQLADAAQSSAFKHHPDGSVRMFGGYNVMTFGDMFQIPPIPDSGALFLPP